jgi:glutamine synthetase
MKSVEDVLAFVRENQIEFIDFRFTGVQGRWQHLTYPADAVDQYTFERGISFDGSSVPGFVDIEKSDMIMMPDPSSACIDPFTAQATLMISCDIHRPKKAGGHESFYGDPRSTARRAEKYLKHSGIASEAFFGPELEFFVFDDVRYTHQGHQSSFIVDSEHSPHNASKEYTAGNNAFRPLSKDAYCAGQPVDAFHDMRSEMLTMLRTMGLTPSLHHHEVSPAQCELGFAFSTLVNTADNVQKYKHAVRNVAHSYGKTVTFMPKPIQNENGSGMHVHQSLWNAQTPLFAGDKYADLSEMALHYIGGILHHAKALAAFTNPTTNSYKRLVPGFEAPVYISYSNFNRSALIRIPYGARPKEKRIETRFPDPMANPYLAFAALLMAGLDGIKRKLHPGDAAEKNLYELSERERKEYPSIGGSLHEALIALEHDHDFLIEGGVFTKDQISTYIRMKMEEVTKLQQAPHPLEYMLYYNG